MYQQPERIRARQILVKLDPEATPEQKAQALERAQALAKELEGGKDFAEVARASSEDLGTKGTGGDLGWVERGNWEPALANAAFALEPGKVTSPIETKYGIHLVKVEEKRPAADKKLEEVQDEIATTLYKKEKAKELAQAEAQKALAAGEGGQDALRPLPAGEGGPAGAAALRDGDPSGGGADGHLQRRQHHVPHLGPAPDLLTRRLRQQGRRPCSTRCSRVGEGFVVAQVTERKKPSDEARFAAEEERAAAAGRARPSSTRCAESFVKALKKQGKVQTNTEAIDQVSGG